MSKPYSIWVNRERTVMVRSWGVMGILEVCTRESPDAVWGPGVRVVAEPILVRS